MTQLAKTESELEQARKETETLLQEPALIQRRIESSLRAKGNLPSNLPIRSNDLFADSVEQRINAANEQAAVRLTQWEVKLEEADQVVADLRANLKLIEGERDTVQVEYHLADAARRGDEEAFRSIGARLLKLKQLSGHCDEGNLPFSQCLHVQAEINILTQASLRDARDKTSLQRAMAESVSRAGRLLERKKGLESKINAVTEQVKPLVSAQQKVRMGKRTAEIEANKWPALLDELDRWEATAGSAQAKETIDASRAKCILIEQDLNRLRTQLTVLQQERSERERGLAHITGVSEFLCARRLNVS
jgi:hypothetical protein